MSDVKIKNSKMTVRVVGCNRLLFTSTSSRSPISGHCTKRLTSTLNDIIYYYYYIVIKLNRFFFLRVLAEIKNKNIIIKIIPIIFNSEIQHFNFDIPL
jgi:hypothetical protein